jgi:hypothetical protein
VNVDSEETTYKKKEEKNQTKTRRKQGEHGDGEGRKPSSPAKPHKAAGRTPLRMWLKKP